MTINEIREVVKLTIEELRSQNALTDPYPIIKKEVERLLYLFFSGNRAEGTGITQALHEVSEDEYIDIIYLYYRDKYTLEKIAEIMDKDTTTISRNRKRLILELYSLINKGSV